eukprot:12625-Heterococcus_DN1.PRE.1
MLLPLSLLLLNHALQQRDDARESAEMDQTRMARDADMAHAAAAQAQAEAALTVEGDILGAARFADSTLLRDGPGGCSVLSGALPPSAALGTFRERAVNLLLLETKAAKWYKEVLPCVHTFFEQLGSRLQARCGAAYISTNNNSSSSSSSSSGSTAAAAAAAAVAEAQLVEAAAALTTEVTALTEVLFRMPEGGSILQRIVHAASVLVLSASVHTQASKSSRVGDAPTRSIACCQRPQCCSAAVVRCVSALYAQYCTYHVPGSVATRYFVHSLCVHMMMTAYCLQSGTADAAAVTTAAAATHRGVPREFLDCARASQLEEDGLEEVQVDAVASPPGSGASSSSSKASGSAAKAAVVVIEVD